MMTMMKSYFLHSTGIFRRWPKLVLPGTEALRVVQYYLEAMLSPTAEDLQFIHEWLGGLRLEQYSLAFQEVGLRTVWECRELTACQLECMGVALPGHRKRILLSLQKLFPSEQGISGEEEEEGHKPIPRERTKFRTSAGTDSEVNSDQKQNLPTNNSVTHKQGPPPIPPRATQNCPPVPFLTVSDTAAMTAGDESVTPSDLASVSLTKATQPRPVPTPVPVPVRPQPRNLPLAPRRQTGDRKPSPVSTSAVSPSHVSPSCPSSSSTEQFHLYEQCSSPGRAELGIPPLPPKSYAVVTPREPKVTLPARPSRRPPIPPRNTMATPNKTTPLPRSPTALR